VIVSGTSREGERVDISNSLATDLGIRGCVQPRPRPVLVMVSGSSGAGKSVLAMTIGERMGLPVVSRDALKSGICFTAGEVPRNIPQLAAEPFWSTLKSLSMANVSLVAEWALRRSFADERLRALTEVADVRLVYCKAPREILLARLRNRLANDRGPRWPFPDAKVIEELSDPSFSLADFAPPELSIAMLEVDTTDGYRPDFVDILGFCFGGKAA
jgi:AAA domain-containing protein